MKKKPEPKPKPQYYPSPFDHTMDPVMPCQLCGWNIVAHEFPTLYPATKGHRFLSIYCARIGIKLIGIRVER